MRDFPKYGSNAYKVLSLCSAEFRTSAEIYEVHLKRNPDTDLTLEGFGKALSVHAQRGYLEIEKTGYRRNQTYRLTRKGEEALEKADKHEQGEKQLKTDKIWQFLRDQGGANSMDLASHFRDMTPNAIRHALQKLHKAGRVERKRERDSIDLRRYFYVALETESAEER